MQLTIESQVHQKQHRIHFALTKSIHGLHLTFSNYNEAERHDA